MSNLIRFGVSIEKDLLDNFDQFIAERHYITRSEALRDLIRDSLIQHRIADRATTAVLGTLTIVYDHHTTSLVKEMTEIQHEHHHLIRSVMHLHVSHEDCLEVIALFGESGEVQQLSDRITSLKGVKNGKLFLTLPSSQIAS